MSAMPCFEEVDETPRPAFRPGDTVKFKAPAHASMVGKRAVVLAVANAHEQALRNREAEKTGWPKDCFYDVRLTARKKFVCDDGVEAVPREFSVPADVLERA